MRSKLPEKRGRQKVARPPTYRIENEYNPEAMPQYFQVSVNILEGRKLAWVNPQSANSYVIVALGKKQYRTNIRRNMEEPYYRESFVFELYTSIRDLQRSSLWLAVMEPRCYAPPRLFGEASIDLGAIWIQPLHQVFHKWVQLCLPQEPTAGSVGFLQVDVSIIFREEVQVMPTVIRDDKLEDNLLLPYGSEQQCANYLITIYGAYGLPNGSQLQGDKRFGKPPSTFIRVSFCGLVAKTATIHRTNNPMYCEQISMVEMFPNMSQFIHFEVCLAEGCFNRVLACTHLKLGQISHDGENGFLPTFGPSFLHMYGTTFTGTSGLTGEDGPYHRGTLLVALKTTVPFYQQVIRNISVEPVSPILLENLWELGDFCIFCPIFEVSMLDRRVAGKFCGIAITIGEIPCENKSEEEFNDMMNEVRSRKLHYTGCLEVLKNQPVYGYIDFCNSFPVLQLVTRLPDFRFTMYRNNMIHGIVTDLYLALNEVESRLKNFNYNTPSELMETLNKVLYDVMGNILKFLDIVQYAIPNLYSAENTMRLHSTDLDQKQFTLQKEEIGKILQLISHKLICSSTQSFKSSLGEGNAGERNSVTRKTVKLFLTETQNLAQNLKNLIYKSFEGWPDIIVWLLNDGSRVAYTKISPADVIYSTIPEQSGKDCGRIQSIYLKPLKCPKHINTLPTGCHCVVGKVELTIWMGLYLQRSAFASCLSSGYQLKVKDYDMCIKSSSMLIECRAFIYKAKLNFHRNGVTSIQTYVRINTLNALMETKVRCSTLSPVWNQVLKMHKMVFMTPERLAISPPIVLVEVNNRELSDKTEIIGRFQIQPTVEDRQDYESAPKLKWFDLYKGIECTGQLLMSVQFLQIPERVLKTTIYNSVEESFVATPSKEVDVSDDIESLPTNLLPLSTSYKVDVYWWGLRDSNITKKPSVLLEIEELSIKSDIITNKRSNCNFPNGRATQIFEAPLNEEYCPLLSIKLFDSSTFGRTSYLGTKIVKNPTKYIVKWLPKVEREASLKRVSIMSSDFVQVNQTLFIKKSSHLLRESGDYGSNISIKKSPDKCKNKRRKWYQLFWQRELDEEEYTLLPMFDARNLKVLSNKSNDTEKDWWLKYLRSEKDYNDEEYVCPAEKLIIYESELESQPEFSKFRDWCSKLKLYNGKKTGIPDKDEKLYCGILKAGIAIYRWPPPANTIAVTDSGVELNKGFFENHPSNDPENFLVRVYLIKGINLKTKEFTGKSDPYVILSCGKTQMGDRYNYVSNTLNPIFGCMYEFRCNLPEDYILMVSLYNYEASLPDQLIGCTYIDLEDRIYSKHRARVGLPPEYSLAEPYKWRDCVKPSAILDELCSINHFPSPTFSNNGTAVMVNGVEYKDTERDKTFRSVLERKENLCLSLLHKWYTLPICGYHLVPEHVETRTLYHPDKPTIDNGKLHMWVDIFPLDTGLYIPLPIDVTPRKIEDYELRLTVYSVRALILNNDHSTRNISDLYIKAYIGFTDQAQITDVHYQCLSGKGDFNWRMIFHFQYQHAIRKLVRKERGLFTEYDESIPPILIVQLMDNEAACSDNYLGSLILNLNSIPRGVKQVNECTLDLMENAKKINLFTDRTLRAWWPLGAIDQDSGATLLAGKIDLELTLLSQENATLMPVGFGREPPFPLPEPMRPEIGSNKLYNKIINYIKICRMPPFFVWALAFIIFVLIVGFLVLYFQLPAIIEYWLWM